jgi:hypothetical protein
MNTEINIETLLFRNETYTDQTNSKMFEKVNNSVSILISVFILIKSLNNDIVWL